MNPPTLNQPLLAISDYAHAQRWLWRSGYWKWLLWPFVCSLVLFPVYIYSVWWATDALSTGLIQLWQDAAEHWSYWLVWPFMFLIGLFFGYILLKNLIMLLCAPLNAFLAEAVLNEKLGQPAPTGWRDFASSMWRAVLLTLVALFAGLFSMILLLMLGVIPVIGALIALLIGTVIQGFLTAWGFFDPVYERSGMSMGQGLRHSLRHAPTLLGNGVPFVLLFQIPILGWTLAPSYGTVAGVLTALRLQQRLQQTPQQGQT